MARAEGAEVTKLEFPAKASFKEVLDAMVKSGAFDVLKGDPEKREVRRLA